MRTTVAIADPLLERAKRCAAERGVTLSEVVEDALRIHLATPSSKKRKRFVLKTERGVLLDPAPDYDRTSAFLTMDDEEAFRQSR